MRRWALCATLGVGLGATSVAVAADLTAVASSFDDDNPFDFRFRFGYEHTEKRAQIKRERSGLPGQTEAKTFRDLEYRQSRDVLAMRAEIGLYHDLALHVELPIILRDISSYRYDDEVNALNSSTVNDNIVAPPYDSARGGQQPTNSGLLFRGANRGGISGSGADAFDTLNIGLTWAPLSQKRDSTKPTWTVGFEGQFSIGTIKKFERFRPPNHGVSEGLHQLIFRTTVSRRLKWFEPYWGLWYLLPVPRSGSLFVDYGPNQVNKDPQHRGGTVFGFEAIAYDRPKRNTKIAIDLRGRVEGRFNGMGYSEAWEMFASSPGLACDAASQNLACDPALNKDSDPDVQHKYQGRNFSGLSFIENYATLGVDVALTAQVTRYAHFRTAFNYTHDQSHLITGDDIGRPGEDTGRVTNATEYNPVYRPNIDLPGRRYRVDNVNAYTFYIWGELMF